MQLQLLLLSISLHLRSDFAEHVSSTIVHVPIMLVMYVFYIVTITLYWAQLYF